MTTNDPTADYEALAALAEAATPGPWSHYSTLHCDEKVVGQAGHWPADEIAAVSNASEDYGRANAAFIAAANPTTVLALIADLRELRRYGTPGQGFGGYTAYETNGHWTAVWSPEDANHCWMSRDLVDEFFEARNAVTAEKARADAAEAEVERLRRENLDAADRAQVEIERLRVDADEDESIRSRMSDLLSQTAVALNGSEPELTMWSWHDLPEKAKAAVDAAAEWRVCSESNAGRATTEQVRADAAEAEVERLRAQGIADLGVAAESIRLLTDQRDAAEAAVARVAALADRFDGVDNEITESWVRDIRAALAGDES